MPDYPAPFLDQIIKTLIFEGGYVNDPADPGGETNYGVSKQSYPDIDIKYLTRDQAIAIYYADYWLKPHIDRLPDWLSGKVFDMGVNMGTKTAIIILQNTCNLWYDKIITDGIIGTHTIATLSKVKSANDFLDEYRHQLLLHYQHLVQLHPSFRRFINGWTKRALA